MEFLELVFLLSVLMCLLDHLLALVLDYVQHERAVMEHCPTDEQIADMWTKQLGQGPFCCLGSFHESCSFLGLVWCCG